VLGAFAQEGCHPTGCTDSPAARQRARFDAQDNLRSDMDWRLRVERCRRDVASLRHRSAAGNGQRLVHAGRRQLPARGELRPRRVGLQVPVTVCLTARRQAKERAECDSGHRPGSSGRDGRDRLQPPRRERFAPVAAGPTVVRTGRLSGGLRRGRSFWAGKIAPSECRAPATTAHRPGSSRAGRTAPRA
jgi:hypothetical protein